LRFLFFVCFVVLVLVGFVVVAEKPSVAKRAYLWAARKIRNGEKISEIDYNYATYIHPNLWKTENYNEFLESRRRLIAEAIKEKLSLEVLGE